MKKMKSGRVTGIDEVRVEMLMMAERVGVRWTRELLNTNERDEDSRGVSDGVGSSYTVNKETFSRPWKIPRYHIDESYSERIMDGNTRRTMKCEM